MAFYISPPGGNISLQRLTQYAETRLKFLLQVCESDGDKMKLLDIVTSLDNVADSECLIEGTVTDRVSHFMLRLACCNHGDMSSFLVDAETTLFNFRFSCMKKNELVKLFRSLNAALNKKAHVKCSSSVQSLEHIFNIFRQIKESCHSWRLLVSKYLNGEDTDVFRVPFHAVPQLVATRSITLQDGVALVPFCMLRDVVTGLVSEVLRLGVLDARKNCVTEDERILQIFGRLKYLYRQSVGHCTVYGRQLSLSHWEVDRVVPLFPPCMARLHKVLRDNHRLKHHDRIRYTLFLKEAGLPVHEALMFWRKEYSQLPANHAGCCHDWEGHGDRYTYNIRHLYGLEGSRINYRGHACSTLQKSPISPTECGGCPFAQYDTEHLRKTMYDDGIQNTDRILELSESGNYGHACRIYMMDKLKMPSSVFEHDCQCPKYSKTSSGAMTTNHTSPCSSVSYSYSNRMNRGPSSDSYIVKESRSSSTDCLPVVKTELTVDYGSFVSSTVIRDLLMDNSATKCIKHATSKSNISNSNLSTSNQTEETNDTDMSVSTYNNTSATNKSSRYTNVNKPDVCTSKLSTSHYTEEMNDTDMSVATCINTSATTKSSSYINVNTPDVCSSNLSTFHNTEETNNIDMCVATCVNPIPNKPAGSACGTGRFVGNRVNTSTTTKSSSDVDNSVCNSKLSTTEFAEKSNDIDMSVGIEKNTTASPKYPGETKLLCDSELATPNNAQVLNDIDKGVLGQSSKTKCNCVFANGRDKAGTRTLVNKPIDFYSACKSFLSISKIHDKINKGPRL